MNETENKVFGGPANNDVAPDVSVVECNDFSSREGRRVGASQYRAYTTQTSIPHPVNINTRNQNMTTYEVKKW